MRRTTALAAAILAMAGLLGVHLAVAEPAPRSPRVVQTSAYVTAAYPGPTTNREAQWTELGRKVDLVRFYAWAAAQPPPEPTPARAVRRRSASSAVAYDAGSIEGIICSVFGDACPRAVRIAQCESGMDPSARNRSGASGLFQLLGHGDMFEAHGWSADDWADPYKNSVVAFDLSRGGTSWSAWVCRG